MNKTCKRQLIIWRTDANGQLGLEAQRKGKAPPVTIPRKENRTLHEGAARTEKGNGKQLRKICQKHQMMPTTTWKKPKIAKKDRCGNQKQKEEMAKENGRMNYKTNTPPTGKSTMRNQAGK